MNWKKKLPEVEVRPAPPSDVMAEYVEFLHGIPHFDYLDFMAQHNGADGPVGKESYIGIWPLEEAITGTEDAGTPEFAPGLFLFAGDGGDTAYAFDRQDPRWPIVSVSLTSMSREEMKFVAATFTEFIQRLANDELI